MEGRDEGRGSLKMGVLTFCRSVLKEGGGFERNNDGGKRMSQIGKEECGFGLHFEDESETFL